MIENMKSSSSSLLRRIVNSNNSNRSSAGVVVYSSSFVMYDEFEQRGSVLHHYHLCYSKQSLLLLLFSPVFVIALSSPSCGANVVTQSQLLLVFVQTLNVIARRPHCANQPPDPRWSICVL